MRNLTFSLTSLILVLFLPIACQSSSEKIICTEQSVDFLFQYFDLDPILKYMPKPVQFMISKDLVDLYAGCFTLEQPYRTISFKGKIETIAFNNNNGGKFLVFNKEDMLMFYDTEKDILHEREPFSRKRTYPGQDYEKVVRVAFNHDDSKVVVLGQLTIHEFKDNGDGSTKDFDFVEDEPIDNSFKTYAISNVENLLPSKITTLSYTQDDRIMVTAKDTTIALVDKSYTQCDELYTNPKPIEEEWRHHYNTQFWVLKDRYFYHCAYPESYSALFSRAKKKIIVFSDKTYKELDVTEGKYPFCTKICALSPNGRFLAAVPIITDLRWELLHPLDTSLVYIWDIPSDKLVTIHEIPEITKSLTFTTDSLFLLVRSSRIWRLYDLSSNKCIAQKAKAYSYEDNVRCFSTFNTSGTLFATATLKYDKKYSPNPFTTHIDIWKINPLWKDLAKIYTGQLTIEQVLFILFLRDISRKGLTVEEALPSLGEKFSHNLKDIKKSLQQSFSSFEGPMAKYIDCLLATMQTQPSNSFEENVTQ